MFLVRFLRRLTLAAKALCFAALVCLVAYFPLGYAGEVVVYPILKWDPLVNRMAIEDSVVYLFVLALACAIAQMLDSFFSNMISRKSSEADDRADSANADT